MKQRMWIGQLVLALLLLPVTGFGQTILLEENFDNANFASRGWYEASGGTISSTQRISGSTGSFECFFKNSASNPLRSGGCEGGTPGRHKFTPSNSVYLSFWMKHSASWQGKGTHIIYLLTTADGDYSPLAMNHLTAYVNDSTISRYYMDLELQDALNINTANINVDLTRITENRAAHGCNGVLDTTHDFVSCYQGGGGWVNMRNWKVANPFTTGSGPYNMQDWHHIEAYFKLNTIDANGKGRADGILQFWFDGQLAINKNTVNFRTGAQPTMLFNQLIVGPYMGSSDTDQTFWIDNLTVATAPPTTTRKPVAPVLAP